MPTPTSHQPSTFTISRQELHPTNLVHGSLSTINLIVVESIQVAPKLNQLPAVAPRRYNKMRVRLHNSWTRSRRNLAARHAQ